MNKVTLAAARRIVTAGKLTKAPKRNTLGNVGVQLSYENLDETPKTLSALKKIITDKIKSTGVKPVSVLPLNLEDENGSPDAYIVFASLSDAYTYLT